MTEIAAADEGPVIMPEKNYPEVIARRSRALGGATTRDGCPERCLAVKDIVIAEV